MSKTIKGFLLIAVICTGIYFLVYQYIIPKTATATIPNRWTNIPFEIQRSELHEYLGKPFLIDSNMQNGGDTWKAYRNNNYYHLQVIYSADSLIKQYHIDFYYNGRIIKKKYLLHEKSRPTPMM